MWKESSDASSHLSDATTPVRVPASAPQPPATSSSRVRVRIIRPDGSSRDVNVAGHFREEHLCSLVDDELCRLDDGESLILHLFHPDEELTHSLKKRWHEEMSDNRLVSVREVLGPNNDPRQVATQLDRIKERMAQGERINLAIRSPRVAKAARDELRRLLLISQQFEESLLNVWVHGDEDQQQRILGHLEGAGMVRARDCGEFIQRHSDRRWRAPWIDTERAKHVKKPKRQRPKIQSSQEAVAEWIKRVEEGREHSSD